MEGAVRGREVRAGLIAAAVATVCALALAAPAGAAITSVFTNTPTPVPCTAQPDGVRLCSALPRSTVETFDGVPIDVTAAFPPAPASGPDGPYPLVMMFHGYSGEKLGLSAMQTWLDRGYATFSMTTRGFGQSCGTSNARAADPSGCADGYVRLMDTRYEVRDAQELAALLADEGRVMAQRIGATGASYGGAMSIALGALRDRKMLPDGSLVPWTSPAGTPMRIAAAAPEVPWSDLVDALMPNGGSLDYIEDARYRGRTGVRKQTLEDALYAAGSHFFYAPEGGDPDADLTAWHATIAAGEPYDDANGNPLPAIADIRDELTTHHSAYYIDSSQPPAPMLIAQGWNDDLFPADEAVRYYNRTRSRHPGTPIALVLGSIGHQRAQNRMADWALVRERARLWFEHYVKGAGTPPEAGVQALTQACAPATGSGGPFEAPDYARLAPGEVRFGGAAAQTIQPTAGSQAIDDVYEPLTGGDACATTPGADQAGTANYPLDLFPFGGFTMLGAPTVIAELTSPGAGSQVAARLFDVDPSGVQRLIARGLWRPVTSTGPVRQVFQLHANGWKFDTGHTVKLELLPKDSPYGQASNGQQPVTVSNLQLRLPAAELPGALGGLVQAPLPRVMPGGEEPAADFAALTYVRPKGATPLRVSLVPAFAPCTAPNRTHGPPLAFGACAPPQAVSDQLTVGTPDANGTATGFTGNARLGVVVGNAQTPADEADVALSVTLTDVRRRIDLGDYTGELRWTSSVRVTDRANGPGTDEPGTGQDTTFPVAMPCAATADPATGATCSVTTSFDAVVAGAIREVKRSIWQLGPIEVQDGGPDGLAATEPNRTFARQGLFIP